MKSHPKRMEMKKKFLLVQRLPKKLLEMLKWDSPTLLSANSLRVVFFVLFFYYLDVWNPQRNAERTLRNNPVWNKSRCHSITL